MSVLTAHKVNACNEGLQITAYPGVPPGMGPTRYEVGWVNQDGSAGFVELLFQNGPIPEVGINGLTNEALLAIVADRLQGFQNGPYACRENALAITKIEEALHWLHARTRSRIQRGVEGTMQK